MKRAKTLDPKTAKLLLNQLPLPEEQIRLRAQQAVDPAYWRRLCPGQTLRAEGEAGFTAGTPRLTEDTAAIIRHFRHAGYFEAGPVLGRADSRRLRQVVEAVRRAGWPAVFSFVYDEFWRVWSAPPLVSVLGAMLGEGYQLIPHPWCWHVPATSGARG